MKSEKERATTSGRRQPPTDDSHQFVPRHTTWIPTGLSEASADHSPAAPNAGPKHAGDIILMMLMCVGGCDATPAARPRGYADGALFAVPLHRPPSALSAPVSLFATTPLADEA